jgi:hypothetical protein
MGTKRIKNKQKSVELATIQPLRFGQILSTILKHSKDFMHSLNNNNTLQSVL